MVTKEGDRHLCGLRVLAQMYPEVIRAAITNGQLTRGGGAYLIVSELLW